jgi:hypothetical protein
MRLPVTKPGVYDIDIDDYHTQRACDGPSISSSGLRQIIHECPARFWAYSDLNPKRVLPGKKAALDFGRAAHALVLGEPEFHSKFIIAPFDNFLTKEAKQWRDAQTKQIVKIDEWDVVREMALAQKSSPQTMRAFTNGQPEKSLILKAEDVGIWLKARPDWLPDDPKKQFTVEYKTAVTIEPRRLSNAVFGYGYEMQAALGLDAIEIVLGVKPLGMAHVVQEKEPPYLCDLRLFTDEQIAWGRLQYREALQVFADCLKHNHWPGYTEEPVYFETPAWIARQMADALVEPGNEFRPQHFVEVG